VAVGGSFSTRIGRRSFLQNSSRATLFSTSRESVGAGMSRTGSPCSSSPKRWSISRIVSSSAARNRFFSAGSLASTIRLAW
jgi:hypothetical protein